MTNALKIAKLSAMFLSLIAAASPLMGFTINPGEVPGPDAFKIPSAGITGAKGLLSVLENIVYYVYIVFFIIAVLFILIAAFDYLTAAGNEEKIKTAHKQLTYAAIAIVIALLSVSADVIIQNLLGERS